MRAQRSLIDNGIIRDTPYIFLVERPEIFAEIDKIVRMGYGLPTENSQKSEGQEPQETIIKKESNYPATGGPKARWLSLQSSAFNLGLRDSSRIRNGIAGNELRVP
jgi:hypothetical protein